KWLARRALRPEQPSSARWRGARRARPGNSQLREEEGEGVGLDPDGLVQAGTDAVAGVRDAEKHWPAGRGRLLESGRHLERVHGLDPWVIEAREKEYRRVRRSIDDVVVGRVRLQRPVLFRVLDGSELGNVERAVRPELRAQHVVDAHV